MQEYITLEEAAAKLPGKPAMCTVWRWARRGLRVNQANVVVKLQVVYIGRKLCTTEQWLEDFFRRVTEARLGGPFEPVRDVGPLTRKSRWSRRGCMDPALVDEILERAGI